MGFDGQEEFNRARFKHLGFGTWKQSKKLKMILIKNSAHVLSFLNMKADFYLIKRFVDEVT